MGLDLDSVRLGRQATHSAATALLKQILITITATDRIPLRSQLIDAINTANDLDDLEVRISAGQSAMPSLSQGQIAELQILSLRLDQQIITAQLLNFSLAVGGIILEAATRVRDIVQGNMPIASALVATANPSP